MDKKIAIVSFPWPSNNPYKFVSDLLTILVNLSTEVMVIDGNVNRIRVPNKNVELNDIRLQINQLNGYYGSFLWILKCILIQLIITLKLIRLRNDYDIVIFYIIYPYFLLPLIFTKLLNKKSLEVVTRSKPNNSISKILSLQDYFLFNLLDGIVPESEYLVKDLNLQNFNEKILPIGARYVNTTLFYKQKKISDRSIIGFVGRLSAEKGILEFVESISLIINRIGMNFTFLILGDGKLKSEIKEQLKYHDLVNYVELIDWVPNVKVPDYLNKLKLLVLPTVHAEGLPTIILESMACGTPVLTTKIGGINDVICDGQTGFFMEKNSPRCIADNVVKIIENEDLEKISDKAQEQIKEKYVYQAAIDRWSKILDIINK